MNETSIINYPGSKKKLLNFIYNNTYEYIDENKFVLDIFSGTGCVAEMYANNGYKVISNDAEKYSYYITKSLICEQQNEKLNLSKFKKAFADNKDRLFNQFENEIIEERKLIDSKSSDIEKFDKSIIKIWDINDRNKYEIEDINISSIDDLNKKIKDIPFCLFTLYFSGYYFGLEQSIEIDSIRYAIEKVDKTNSLLYTALYYSMKEAVFAKDGHMAQPLNHEKNKKKLFEVRKKSISNIFFEKLEDLRKNINVNNKEDNKSFNYKLSDILENDFIRENVGFIYADPPYTDMQYSRYFHLLNTVSEYYYPKLTAKNGKITSGLYTENRFQSPLSNKKFAISQIEMLIKFARENKINLAISYAYPVDIKAQKSDRYTMDINELISVMKKHYEKVTIVKEEYSHSNNRNSSRKEVYEYLIIGYIDKKVKIKNSNIENKINKFKEEVYNIKATNKNDLYNSMLYWSQKPFNICDKIIDSFSKKNDIILDPFMGSGVTIIEAMNKSMKNNAIGVDINDVPLFLCKTMLKKYDINYLKNEINSLLEEINLIEKVYETKCIKCGNIGIIEKVLFDRVPTINIKEIMYSCNCTTGKITKKPDSTDLKNFCKKRNVTSVKDKQLIENTRIAIKNGETIKNLFTNRNFYVLDRINCVIQKISDENVKQIIKYMYLSIIHKSKIVDKKLGSQWPMWIPKVNCVERNVVKLFKKAIKRTEKALIFNEKNYNLGGRVEKFSSLKSSNYLLIKNGIQNIREDIIPDNSVDLVITDPPYLGQVAYSEYMQLYEPFLKTKIDYDNEIVISNSPMRNKDETNYWEMLSLAFRNVSRMMKNESLLFMYFHDSNLSVWDKLINILRNNNLEFKTLIHISKSKLTLKGIIDPKKTMNGDALLIFQKNNDNVWRKNEKNLETIIDEIKEKSIEMIDMAEDKALSSAELYDNGILEFIIKNDYLNILAKNYKDLLDIFETFLCWDEYNMKWKKED